MDAADRADVTEAMKLIVTENAKLCSRLIDVVGRLELRIASLESGIPLAEIELRRAEEARDNSPS